MQFGIVGLGRMGSSLAMHAAEKGHQVTGYDPSQQARQRLLDKHIDAVDSLEALAQALQAPRTIILYVPHGDPTQSVCDQFLRLLSPGDILVDGGNSDWRDSQRRCQAFAGAGVRFLDVGTSGGVTGARNGACFMAGGDRSAFEAVRPLLRDLAVDEVGVYYAGPSGAGHFTKLVHNAIEFGMVQSIAEGMEMLQRSGFELDLPSLLTNWQHGSVVRSWLVELMANAYRQTEDLSDLSTYVEDTGEVKWVLDWALEKDIPAPAINASQIALMQYRDLDSPMAKAVALLRNQYGGHPVHHVSE